MTYYLVFYNCPCKYIQNGCFQCTVTCVVKDLTTAKLYNIFSFTQNVNIGCIKTAFKLLRNQQRF